MMSIKQQRELERLQGVAKDRGYSPLWAHHVMALKNDMERQDRARRCISCGAVQDINGVLPCDH